MRKEFLYTLVIPFVFLICHVSNGHTQEPGNEKVLLLEYNGAIHGGTVEVIKEALKKTSEENYQCFIFQLDTPGGTVDATREIVKLMLNSDVPIVVYVGPSGSQPLRAPGNAREHH